MEQEKLIGFEILRLSDKRKIQLFCKDNNEKEDWKQDLNLIINGYLNQSQQPPQSSPLQQRLAQEETPKRSSIPSLERNDSTLTLDDDQSDLEKKDYEELKQLYLKEKNARLELEKRFSEFQIEVLDRFKVLEEKVQFLDDLPSKNKNSNKNSKPNHLTIKELSVSDLMN